MIDTPTQHFDHTSILVEGYATDSHIATLIDGDELAMLKKQRALCTPSKPYAALTLNHVRISTYDDTKLSAAEARFRERFWRSRKHPEHELCIQLRTIGRTPTLIEADASTHDTPPHEIPPGTRVLALVQESPSAARASIMSYQLLSVQVALPDSDGDDTDRTNRTDPTEKEKHP